ncbi:hypothetical protein trd_1921 [Thermomicrobium roseum DSM 5159]|uniref:Uncharacterized protein n=1 Tax=Thermomicrobium roseum (strain ATCC 27502 / DSM 5159 / P-2) TaxID=309801 RepID=B9L221_THERP|nr:hypothetical protein trd_1921 [Thermomicrobium roseum DSM 5159]
MLSPPWRSIRQHPAPYRIAHLLDPRPIPRPRHPLDVPGQRSPTVRLLPFLGRSPVLAGPAGTRDLPEWYLIG